jgi:hypothetical protein
MDFIKVMENVTSQLDTAGVRYALIGGFAIALRGVQRATIDMDFILRLEDWEKADQKKNGSQTGNSQSMVWLN